MTPQILNLLTVSEFCEAVGISRSTWHKLKRQGKAPAIVNIGGIIGYAGKLSKHGLRRMKHGQRQTRHTMPPKALNRCTSD